MTIQEPGRRLMHSVPLKFVQKRVKGGGHRPINAGLSLTSMIDFLVVTVVFLLMTFDASGEKPANELWIPVPVSKVVLPFCPENKRYAKGGRRSKMF